MDWESGTGSYRSRDSPDECDPFTICHCLPRPTGSRKIPEGDSRPASGLLPEDHDLGKVLDLVGECEPGAAETLQESTLLTPFGAEGRYPGDTPELLPGEETRAVRIACHVRDVVNETLKTYLA